MLHIHTDLCHSPLKHITGAYNEWLIDLAARRSANECLTHLLDRYRPKSVFSALARTSGSLTSAGEIFLSRFSEGLRARERPFIPTRVGLLTRQEAILPPAIDNSGFWESHFSDAVATAAKGKRAFLSPQEDSSGTRSFLKMAGVDVLEAESLLDFAEVACQARDRAPSWWHDIYVFMAKDAKLSHLERSSFLGRRIIPTAGSSVIAVPSDDSVLVCFPPTVDSLRTESPECFSRVFVFLNRNLAKHLQEGESGIRSWIADRLAIARFEAADLLPRVVRRVAPEMFSGKTRITYDELLNAWTFLKRMIEASRIHASDFWREIGRFPLPIVVEPPGGTSESRPKTSAMSDASWHRGVEPKSCGLGAHECSEQYSSCAPQDKVLPGWICACGLLSLSFVYAPLTPVVL